jgi:small-conductance mechanosensitive channel/CRP-like cAMP-binding protein
MDEALVSSVSWGVGLVLVVPFVIIVMNELLERQQNAQSGFAALLRFARDLVLPLFVLVLVLRVVFGVSSESAIANIASTVLWMLLIVFVYRMSVLLVGDGEYAANDWRRHAPQLFLRLVPYSIIGIIIYHVSQNLWALPVREMATTLGIGSVVIAFALQATLSNLVSGLLMIANSPFKTGDWVRVDDIEGQIAGVNWRYTEIVDWQGNLVVFPNGAMADGSIYNFSRPTTETLMAQTLKFSMDTPPNDVKALLMQTLAKTPRIEKDPGPLVYIAELSNPMITYGVEYWITDFGSKDSIKGDFLTRVWYAARRSNIKMPLPMQEFVAHRSAPKDATIQSRAQERRTLLAELPGFSTLSEVGMDVLVEDASVLHFAATERILDIGDAEPGVFIIGDGEVHLEMVDRHDTKMTLDTIGPGGIFGENGLFGRAVSPTNVIAQTDCQILLVSHRDFNDVLNRERALNEEINAMINKRNRGARRLNGSRANGAAHDRKPEVRADVE